MIRVIEVKIPKSAFVIESRGVCQAEKGVAGLRAKISTDQRGKGGVEGVWMSCRV